MTWRMARSLEVARVELGTVYPDRDTTSDGGIGDAAHAARDSKHNPGPDGIVEARDFDEDVSGRDGQGGRPLWPFVQHLLGLARGGHPALAGPGAHIIYEGRIWSHAHGWVERPYTGPNAHLHHAHVAVVDGVGKDSTLTWRLRQLLAQRPASRKPDRWLGLTNPPMTGHDVAGVINALRVAGRHELPAGGRTYTRAVADAIAEFQRRRRITERGVGPLTWQALRKVVH